MTRPLILLAAFLSTAALFGAASTKVGGSGKTKVGGSGATKVTPVVGGSSVSVGNRANSGATTTSPITVPTFTVASVSPLVVAVFWQGSETISSVTWSGTSMGAVRANVVDSTTVDRVAVYVLTTAAAGTGDVVVTMSGNPGGGAYVAVCGTVGGSTVGTFYTRTDSAGTGPGRNVDDSANGDQVFHAAGVYAATITFDGGETTTNNTANNIAGSNLSVGLSTRAAVGASTAVGCTDAAFYAEIAFAVKP